MNDFLQQFLVESRELAEQATEGLLALEHSPQDADQLDAVFRAMHTLKGGAGIVDFFAMDRAVHAAEDLLSCARAGTRALTPAAIGDCLACVDQVLQWLDILEQTGELPNGSDADADRIIARFAAAASPVYTEPSAESAGGQGWIPELLARHPGERSRAVTAVRHSPDPGCFFQGEDPVAKLAALPGLLAFEVTSATPWPKLQDLDPFRCNLLLSALTRDSLTETNNHLRGCSGSCELIALTGSGDTEGGLPARARELLAAQLALVREHTSAGSHGYLASAAMTGSNVLRSCGRDAEADQLARLATADSMEDTLPALQAVLTGLLKDDAVEAHVAPVPAEPAHAAARPETTSRTLRIDAERIDSLVRLTGELTVARNALAHLVKLAFTEANPIAPALKARHAAFENLIGEMQRSVLALRVLPLRVVFQRLPRLLREISDSLGKPVALKIVGEDTEADKAIVEMLFEPLLHVVRNAIDHGVESAALRAQRGKPRAATIELQAARQGDQVLVEVSDDGAGMDVQRIRAVAAERGVAKAEILDTLSEADLIDLVFAPGFSTATEVTALSGRGVGMDAVRTSVERVGGRVSIHSRAGRGTTVRFMLPFSVMMTTVMSVEAGGQMFGVPLDTIVETIRVPRRTLAAVGNARAVVVREQTIPVFDLAQMLGESAKARDADDATIVIAAFAGQRCGLDVDALGERLDVILKPLDGLLAGTPGITGTTLLGDGRVLLVLDIAELLQ